MKRFTVVRLLYSLLAMLCMASMLTPDNAVAEENRPGTIAFLPFAIHAGKDMNFLKEGVRDMLASRLAGHTGLAVADKMQTDNALRSAGDNPSLPELRALGSRLGADYLVSGSLTRLDAELSIDASVLKISDDVPPQSFHVTAATMDQIIPAVDRLAQEINRRLFAPPIPAESIPPTGAQTEDAATPTLETAHPDRAFIPQTTDQKPPAVP